MTQPQQPEFKIQVPDELASGVYSNIVGNEARRAIYDGGAMLAEEFAFAHNRHGSSISAKVEDLLFSTELSI